jgi:long-subunit fatty acid transport protein
LRTSNLIFAALLANLASTQAMAQVIEPLVTPSHLLLNYEIIPPGREEGLEGGAVSARVTNATSTWYNPAGLASVEKLDVSVASPGYQIIWMGLNADSNTEHQTAFTGNPSFVGVVLGPPVVDPKKWRVGASVATPRAWSPNFDAPFDFARPGGAERITYGSYISLSTVVPTVALGYPLLPNLRVGVGVQVAITSLVENVTLSDQLRLPSSDPTLLRNLRMGSVLWHLLGEVGIQWDITHRLLIGALVKTPGARLYGSGLFSFDQMQGSASGSSSISVYDKNAHYSLPVPFEANLGVAYRTDWGALELDGRFHAGSSLDSLVTSDQQVSTVVGGVETLQSFPRILFKARPVWGASLGGRLDVSSVIHLHAGVFTNPSPVSQESSPLLFPQIDLYGTTAGISLSEKHVSGSLGLAYVFGSSKTFRLTSDLEGGAVESSFKVDILSAAVSLSYRF